MIAASRPPATTFPGFTGRDVGHESAPAQAATDQVREGVVGPGHRQGQGHPPESVRQRTKHDHEAQEAAGVDRRHDGQPPTGEASVHAWVPQLAQQGVGGDDANGQIGPWLLLWSEDPARHQGRSQQRRSATRDSQAARRVHGSDFKGNRGRRQGHGNRQRERVPPGQANDRRRQDQGASDANGQGVRPRSRRLGP